MITHRRLLDSLIDNEKSRNFSGYSPGAVTALLDRLGNPHRGLRCVHIAGTNGKGSTACYLRSVLSAAGRRTGLYTSPHLVRINERISIDGKTISDASLDALAGAISEVLAAEPGVSPTWFDVLTVMAFLYFRERKVDFAVIETGLGGRLDSTNVITPLASVITSIALDHVNVLGKTIEAIAREKAGIIKPGVPAVTACSGPALEVIADDAAGKVAPLLVLGRDFSASGLTALPAGFRYDFIFRPTPESRLAEMRPVEIPGVEYAQPLPLQAANSALALAAVSLLGLYAPADAGAMRRGIKTAVIPGRFERLAEDPLVIFDPAHNPQALEETARAAAELAGGRERAAVVHFMADKDIAGMLRILRNRLTNRIIYVRLRGERSYIPDPGNAELTSVEGTDGLVRELGRLGGGALVLFTGSFRLYETALAAAKALGAGSAGSQRRKGKK